MENRKTKEEILAEFSTVSEVNADGTAGDMADVIEAMQAYADQECMRFYKWAESRTPIIELLLAFKKL